MTAIAAHRFDNAKRRRPEHGSALFGFGVDLSPLAALGVAIVRRT